MRTTIRRQAALLGSLAVLLGPWPAAAAEPGAMVTVIVTLQDSADLAPFRRLRHAERQRGVVEALRRRAGGSQAGLHAALAPHRAQGRVARVTPLWIANAVSVMATPEVIRELAARADVRSVTPDELAIVPTGAPAGPPTWSVAAVAAPELWALGHTGQGVVVASLDTGVDASHPDLAGRWRGGAGGWFDPYGQHPAPYDPSGHGTWTMGVMVGGDASGQAVGVAPDAQWISAKIFDDAGRATATAIHLAFQWLLDPDGDPATADAPGVVNNSWAYGAPGCNLEFQRDLQALVAAGIVPVFAAGNAGPSAPSSVSPANYAEAFSVGAVSASDAIWAGSSRGPSACTGATFPSVVAPGVGVTTTDLFGFWSSVSGSSIAAPHVAGLVALLEGAFPDATVDRLELALQGTARDLGVAGPDAAFGSGAVSARAAYDDLAAAPPPPPPPVAADDAYAVAAGTSATFAPPGVLANDAAPSGRPLSAALGATAAHGILAFRADGGFDYTPAAGFSGADAFTYQASDGLGTSASATVAVTVTPAPPSAAPDAYAVTAGTTLTVAAPGVLANDVDPQGLPLAASLVAGPAHGALVLQASGAFSYQPAAGYAGPDAFSYQAGNGTTASVVVTVTLTVTQPVNQPPLARDDAASTRAGTAVTISVLANDVDPEGALVAGSVTVVAKPKNGSVTRTSNGALVYTPARRFTGTDLFTYTVSDAAGARSNVATVRVTVR